MFVLLLNFLISSLWIIVDENDVKAIAITTDVKKFLLLSSKKQIKKEKIWVKKFITHLLMFRWKNIQQNQTIFKFMQQFTFNSSTRDEVFFNSHAITIFLISIILHRNRKEKRHVHLISILFQTHFIVNFLQRIFNALSNNVHSFDALKREKNRYKHVFDEHIIELYE